MFLSIEPISEYVERMGLQESMFPEALSQQIEMAEILKKIENILFHQYRINYHTDGWRHLYNVSYHSEKEAISLQ